MKSVVEEMEEKLTNAVEVLLQEVPSIPLVVAVKIAHKILALRGA